MKMLHAEITWEDEQRVFRVKEFHQLSILSEKIQFFSVILLEQYPHLITAGDIYRIYKCLTSQNYPTN